MECAEVKIEWVQAQTPGVPKGIMTFEAALYIETFCVLSNK